MFLFKLISTSMEADDRIFRVCGIMMKTMKGFSGINPKYSVIIMPGGISKRYPLEEKHITSSYAHQQHAAGSWGSLKDDILKDIPPKNRRMSNMEFRMLKFSSLRNSTFPVLHSIFSFKVFHSTPRTFESLNPFY